MAFEPAAIVGFVETWGRCSVVVDGQGQCPATGKSCFEIFPQPNARFVRFFGSIKPVENDPALCFLDATTPATSFAIKRNAFEATSIVRKKSLVLLISEMVAHANIRDTIIGANPIYVVDLLWPITEMDQPCDPMCWISHAINRNLPVPVTVNRSGNGPCANARSGIAPPKLAGLRIVRQNLHRSFAAKGVLTPGADDRAARAAAGHSSISGAVASSHAIQITAAITSAQMTSTPMGQAAAEVGRLRSEALAANSSRLAIFAVEIVNHRSAGMLSRCAQDRTVVIGRPVKPEIAS